MTLKGYVPPTRKIEVPGNDPFVVRGLSLTDIAQITRTFKGEMEPVFSQLQAKAGENVTAENFDMKMIGAFMLQSAPSIMAVAIAHALNEPDEYNQVVKLPISVQMELIYAIGDLTFEGEGGAKKVLQIVTKMLVGARGLALPNAPQPSTTGTAISAAA